MTGGIIISILALFIKPVIGVLVIFPVIGGIIVFLSIPRMFPQIKAHHHLLYHFERKEDLEKFPYKGAIFFGIGILFPLILLPTKPAVAVILILSVGDAFSTMIGKTSRLKIHQGKSIEGLAAFIISSIIASSMIVDIKTALVFSVTGGIIELFAKINDNIAIPAALSILYILIV